MNKELKRDIVNFILDNEREFQLPNVTVDNFRNYIYDNKGEYLIGGEDVIDFIKKEIELLLPNR